MLSFRADQVRSLAENRFQQRLTRLLSESMPDSQGTVNTPVGQQALRHQCEKARGYGMSAELDIARYVITAWLLGIDFDVRFIAFTDILASPHLTGSQKADAIERISSSVLTELDKGRL